MVLEFWLQLMGGVKASKWTRGCMEEYVMLHSGRFGAARRRHLMVITLGVFRSTWMADMNDAAHTEFDPSIDDPNVMKFGVETASFGFVGMLWD